MKKMWVLMKNIVVAIVIPLSFALGFIFSNALTTLPKDKSTASELCRLELAIRDYAMAKHQLPDSLDDLVRGGYVAHRQIVDRWGNRIEYTVNEKKEILLTSRGDDAIRNSMGCDYAISKKFDVSIIPPN